MRTLGQMIGWKGPKPKAPKPVPEWLFKRIPGNPAKAPISTMLNDGWEIIDSTPVTVQGTLWTTDYVLRKRNPRFTRKGEVDNLTS